MTTATGKKRRRRLHRDDLALAFNDDRVRAEVRADVFLRDVAGNADEDTSDVKRSRLETARRAGAWWK